MAEDQNASANHTAGAAHEGAQKQDSAPVEANLLQFLSGMAMQTLMHLGLMSNPVTKKVETDLVNAKYSIDLLGILQEKMKGNLTEEEDAYLKTSLAQLRMAYVQAVSSPPDPEEQAGDGEAAAMPRSE